MRSKARITVLGLSVLSASTALAAPAPPVYNWTGFYIGASGGGAWQNVNYGAPTLSGSVSPSSVYFGGIAGYNYQFSSMWVLGAEADYGWTHADNTSIISGVQISTHSSWESSIRARAGYLIQPRVLVYGTGGVAFTNQTISVPSLSDSATRSGWTVGAGAEYYVGGSWFVRGEYRYSDYGTRTFIGDLPTGLHSNAFRFGIVTNIQKWDR